MKKLTAGIFAGILGIVTFGAANADIATSAYVTSEINKLDTAATATAGTASGSYINSVTQTDGKVAREVVSFDTEVNGSSTNNNAPTSKAVYTAINTLSTSSGEALGSYSDEATTYIDKTKAVKPNIQALDTQVKTNADNIDTKQPKSTAANQLGGANGTWTTAGALATLNKVTDDVIDNDAISDTKISFTTDHANALNSGITSDKVASYDALVNGEGSVETQIDNALGNGFDAGGTYEGKTVAQALDTKQDKSDSTVTDRTSVSGNHLTAGAGVANNLVALDNAIIAVQGTISSLSSDKVDVYADGNGKLITTNANGQLATLSAETDVTSGKYALTAIVDAGGNITGYGWELISR